LATTFHSASPADARYIWHPDVHERYAEGCLFYLIAGEDPERKGTFSAGLRDLLLSLEITSATIHVVYGTFDALVRVWATPGARQRFLRGLRESGLVVRDIQEFTASSIFYDFLLAPAPDLAAIRNAKPMIEDVVRAQRREDLSAENLRQLDALLGLNIVLTIP